jgi:ATP-dependent helicase/nuclease subunit B
MTRPGVICLHRHTEGNAPIEASAWIEKWSQQEGAPIVAAPDRLNQETVTPTPQHLPRPGLASQPWAVPTQITATAYDALRQCHYRFFATTVLALREEDELEEGLDRSDYGIWLHEVLRRFHSQRQTQLAISTEAEDVAEWLRVAQAVVTEKGLDLDGQRPYFLPFEADMPQLAQAYVTWLRNHEAQGWNVSRMEAEVSRDLILPDGGRLRLFGQLDRVDTRHVDHQSQQLVIDYKTGNKDALKAKVGTPLEDTQLAFYAALQPGDASFAAYVHLDAKGVHQIEHADVSDSAQALLEGLSQDWIRIRAGQGLAAMGEGASCTYCQARGLCRKDHWQGPGEPA